jgi:hypothetical protein
MPDRRRRPGRGRPGYMIIAGLVLGDLAAAAVAFPDSFHPAQD